MSPFRHDSQFWMNSFWNKHDYQYSNGSYFFFQPRTSNFTEWNFDMLSPRICRCYPWLRFTFQQLLWVYRWDSQTNFSPRPTSKNSVPPDNGHKRVHSLKFQSVALPNGLIGNLYEPVGWHENKLPHKVSLTNDLFCYAIFSSNWKRKHFLQQASPWVFMVIPAIRCKNTYRHHFAMMEQYNFE